MATTMLFTPSNQATVLATGAATAVSLTLPATKGAFNALRFKNLDTANVAYVSWGSATATATTPTAATAGSVPIGPGETTAFTVSIDTTVVSVIAATGAPIVVVTPGIGL